jgi:hypothetical protein
MLGRAPTEQDSYTQLFHFSDLTPRSVPRGSSLSLKNVVT